MLKTTIITTSHHNVGDDFVREGILFLLDQLLGKFQLSLIHKHLPATARPELAWIHNSKIDRWVRGKRPSATFRITRLLDRLPLCQATDKILQCDLLVQSGAPVYWLNSKNDCSRTEWWDPLIERRWKSRKKSGIFLNLAGGTCQHYGSDGSEIIQNTPLMDHIRRFYDLTNLTTVRDELSASILKAAGCEAHLLPCTSIFAADNLGIRPSSGEFIALNYMHGGGHYDFANNIDTDRWEKTFVRFARKLARRSACRMICHNARELESARQLVPDIPHLYSENHADVLEFYSRARFGIVNRVHGAFALASLGKPAAVVGADTRARMAPMVFAPCIFVNDANEPWLEAQVERLHSDTVEMPARIADLKKRVSVEYRALLQTALRPLINRIS